MRTPVSRKSPHRKQQPPGGITLPSPNTQTIIQMTDIYWGKMNRKNINMCMQIDQYTLFVYEIGLVFGFWQVYPSEWNNSSLTSEKRKRALTCHRLGIGSGEPCHPTHQWLIIIFLNNALQISPGSRRAASDIIRNTSGMHQSCWYIFVACKLGAFIPRPILSRSSGRPGGVLNRVLQSVHANFR